jgi:putative phosphoesterase
MDSALSNSWKKHTQTMISRILILSDTHGLIRPEIAEIAPEFDHVLHAGDIGNSATYDRLKGLNPHLLAVAGNVDHDMISAGFPETLEWRHQGYAFKIVHDIASLGRGEAAGWDFIVFGHSHKPADYTSGKTHFINPGSVGPIRFRLPISYATMEIRARSNYRIRFHEIPSGN